MNIRTLLIIINGESKSFIVITCYLIGDPIWMLLTVPKLQCMNEIMTLFKGTGETQSPKGSRLTFDTVNGRTHQTSCLLYFVHLTD